MFVRRIPTGLGLLLLAASGCGRLGFDATDETVDAAGDAAPDAFSAYASLILADNPVGYYRLEEAGGEAARDASGRQQDGLFREFASGTTSFQLPGVVADSRSAQFRGEGNAGDGSTASVELPLALTAFTGDFTVEVWVRPVEANPIGWAGHAFVWEDHMINGFRLGWIDTMEPQFWTTEGGGTTAITAASPLIINAWTHLAVVVETNEAVMYVNAVEVGRGPLDMVPPGATAERGFGAFHGLYTSAQFDEVAIYEHALTVDRLQARVAAAGQ